MTEPEAVGFATALCERVSEPTRTQGQLICKIRGVLISIKKVRLPGVRVTKHNPRERPMTTRLIATHLCSALGLIGTNGLAFADMVGRYECTVVGSNAQSRSATAQVIASKAFSIPASAWMAC